MMRLCIEDGFEYQIKQALIDFINQYDSIDEARENFNGGDNDDFVHALYERALFYTDLDELFDKVVSDDR